jgi:metal-responsive CopG/Arc/MetJ family transcriptional regulator
MKTRRAHIWLPQYLLNEFDEIVGPRGRSAFLLETAREAVKRRKLVQFLESGDVAWKDVNHPELAKGAAEWVRGLRQESEARGKRWKTRQRRSQ